MRKFTAKLNADVCYVDWAGSQKTVPAGTLVVVTELPQPDDFGMTHFASKGEVSFEVQPSQFAPEHHC